MHPRYKEHIARQQRKRALAFGALVGAFIGSFGAYMYHASYSTTEARYQLEQIDVVSATCKRGGENSNDCTFTYKYEGRKPEFTSRYVFEGYSISPGDLLYRYETRSAVTFSRTPTKVEVR